MKQSHGKNEADEEREISEKQEILPTQDKVIYRVY